MSVRAELLALLAMVALLESCAAVAPPQGGPRDRTPPRRISSSPDSAARNVKQQFVRLVFSEPVVTKDLSKNLLITPQLPPDNPYKLREERNSITLLFDKPLDANTTYSFNFRSGVVDITEGLPATNAALNFSTGAVLDSGKVSGTVTDVLTAKPIAEASVGLYRLADTAGVKRGRPYYTVLTDKEGKFNLSFLKAGPYKIYALVDKNTNGRYDEGEKIAYLPAPITIAGSTGAPVALVLTQPDRRPPLLTTRQASPTQLRLSFSEGLRSAALAPVGSTQALPAVAEALLLTDRGRTVVLFKTPEVGDGRYLLTTADSTGNVGHDTLQVKFPAAPTNGKKTPPPSLYSVDGSPRTVFPKGQVKFLFAVPVRVATGRPFGTLVEDSAKRRPLRLPADGTLSPDRTALIVRFNSRAHARLDIVLDSTAITAITGQALRLRPLRLGISEQDVSNSLSGPITTKEKNFELQLLDDKLQVVASLASPKGSYLFTDVPPGVYHLRVLIDSDGDGHWRNGDPNLLLPPEPVYLDPNPQQVRSGFDMVEPLKF
ncbi:Ig-like domain-containing protein [Hymenobacter sp. BT770]|uniref:Ig-like domain-containing protein n=1 Tax=Hymenobacter sp. BT770 TaxID=2886942 RepID=UPI001D1187E5|nr:Ig-like domain-containing protein [Hymenobacter sp. BT770]MCC3153450.1 Ig-like domain-containing protein [Hymenobacter sp. BT770]MDO3415468.1 Ig-like domain-containing protein [Hymenobacter sp. BT770]